MDELRNIGNIPEKKFSIEEIISEFKFIYKDIQFVIDIFLYYEACILNEKITVKLYV